MGRPVIIRNKLTGELEEFTVGLESEVGLRWGKGLHGVKGNSLEAVELALTKFTEEERVRMHPHSAINSTSPLN
jgi:hypothetical protein